MSASTIFSFFLIGVLCLALLTIPFIVIYFIYKWLAKNDYKLLGIALVVAALLFLSFFIYMVYTSVYPEDRFYFDEYKQTTFREIPNSGVIIKKSSSYPDFHGNYCSASVIKLSKADYQHLLKVITNDRRLQKGPPCRSEELDEVMKELSYNQIKLSFIKSESLNYDGQHLIGFLDDGQTIVIAVCKT